MSRPKMHDGQVETSVALVRALVREQFPRWADLEIRPVASAGTVHDLYRLGDGLLARLPVHPDSPPELDKEERWLPVLAPQLPLAVPVPVARGEPGAGFPGRWAVYEWLDGETSDRAELADPVAAAGELGRFVAALQRVDATGGPAPGRDTWYRGLPVDIRDAPVRSAVVAIADEFDPATVLRAWDAVRAAPAWDGPPVWFHGDLMPGNLLVRDGRLAAVIDWGCSGTGDPAVDAIAAWHVFRGEARDVYRDAVGFDDATWTRGRGWALSGGVMGLAYYRATNPAFADLERRTLVEVLAEA